MGQALHVNIPTEFFQRAVALNDSAGGSFNRAIANASYFEN